MTLQFDEDLVEAAVLACATHRWQGLSSLQVARFHRQRERIYSVLDPEERSTAFFRLHLDWFREWGLEDQLTQPLRDFPVLGRCLRVLAFRKLCARREEGAELYVNEAGDRHAVIALEPQRLRGDSRLPGFLRHELMHLHDMVDPAFEYRPELELRHVSPNQQRLARERYRVLWDVAIDGRLTRTGWPAAGTREHRARELAAAFPFWGEAQVDEVFETFWTRQAPTHAAFLGLISDMPECSTGSGPSPGAACPLCGFPTFHWAGLECLTDGIVTAIRTEFPDWTPAAGVCGRCLAIYRVQRPESGVVA